MKKLRILFLCSLTIFIGLPPRLFAQGQFDGVWSGVENITFREQNFSEVTGSIVFQENDSTIFLFDPLFPQGVRLVKSGNQWILPSPISIVYYGVRVTFNTMSMAFRGNSQLNGTIKFTGAESPGTATLSFQKSACSSLSMGSTLSNLFGSVDSVKCYEVVLPQGAQNLSVRTWGGSGDADLLLVYHRPTFDYRLSENEFNNEQVAVDVPDAGKWYVVIYGFDHYTGLNLRVTYTSPPAPSAGFSATPLRGFVPLTVKFTDQSAGVITKWEWDFGDGTKSTTRHPNHTYNTPGSYTVKLKVTGPGGSNMKSTSDYIKVVTPVRSLPWIGPLLLE